MDKTRLIKHIENIDPKDLEKEVYGTDAILKENEKKAK